MLKMPEPWDSANESCKLERDHREKSMFQTSKSGGQEEPTKPLELYKELTNLVFVLLGFALALFQYFLTFRMAIDILCHYALQYANYFLILQGITVERLP